MNRWLRVHGLGPSGDGVLRFDRGHWSLDQATPPFGTWFMLVGATYLYRYTPPPTPLYPSLHFPSNVTGLAEGADMYSRSVAVSWLHSAASFSTALTF